MKDSVIKILLVDDDSDDLQVIAEALKEEHPNLHVTQSGNGSDALRHLSESSDYPHLIILDINMNGIGGKETLKLLKATKRYSHIPIVMFTSSNDDNDRKFCEEYGMQMINKPSSFNELTGKARFFWRAMRCSCFQPANLIKTNFCS